MTNASSWGSQSVLHFCLLIIAFLDLTCISTHVGSFGIGTWLMNDFKMKSSGYKEKSKALNMVIKLGSIDGKECVKISDDIAKVRTALKHRNPL